MVILEHCCPYNKSKIQTQTHTEGRWPWEGEAEIGLMCHVPRQAWDKQKLEEVRKDFHEEALEGAWPWQQPGFRLLAPKM